ncbi:hypothetical protein [Zobellella taiwanensis]|uniref:hypothetical protein n=1 Tax=Zobellella taiwanensis TaxID=347535 RepID=UPI001C639443|nr:hypothetical protein [Zobellella taiwanensis]
MSVQAAFSLLPARRWLVGLLWCLLLPAWAGALPPAEGPVVLRVSGLIGNTNSPGVAEFDQAMLEALPRHEFTTHTPWTRGEHHYRGLLVRDLLALVQAGGRQVRITALNDFHANLPVALAERFPVLLATHQDGIRMRVRDKGPLWLLLPLKDVPELDTKQYHEVMVWQINRMEVY